MAVAHEDGVWGAPVNGTATGNAAAIGPRETRHDDEAKREARVIAVERLGVLTLAAYETETI
jgi:hypothetical protein